MSAVEKMTPAEGRLALARIEAADVRDHNRLVGQPKVLAFPWAGQECILRFFPLAEGTAASGTLALQLAGRRLELGLPQVPELGRLGVKFAGIELGALPAELVPAVLEVALSEVLVQLKRVGVEAGLESWTPAPPSRPAAYAWSISRADGSMMFQGRLHADTETVAWIAEKIHASGRPVPGRADTVPMALVVSLGAMALPLNLLATVSAGDVLMTSLVPMPWQAREAEAWIGSRRVGRVRRKDGGFQLFNMNVSTEPKSKAATPGTLRVDDLPVQVSLDVGQLDLTVGQLRTVGEGFTFELPVGVERLVTLRANGREIGQGELVEIGDKVGVRVVQWSLA